MSASKKRLMHGLEGIASLDNLWRALFWGLKENAPAADDIICHALRRGLEGQWILLDKLHKNPELEWKRCDCNLINELLELTDAQREDMQRDIGLFAPAPTADKNADGYGDPTWSDFLMPGSRMWDTMCEICQHTLDNTIYSNLFIDAEDWAFAMQRCGRNQVYWPSSSSPGPNGGIHVYQAFGNAWEWREEVAVNPIQTVQARREEVVRHILFEKGETEQTLGCITRISKNDLYKLVRKFEEFKTTTSKSPDPEPITRKTFQENFLRASPFRWPDKRLAKAH